MKKYLIGAIAGFMLSLGVSAHAEVSNLVDRVVQGMFPVTIDGNSVGNAIVVDDKTYLPVREFGEATGYKVTFSEDRAVILTKNDTAATTPSPTPVSSAKPSVTPAPTPVVTKQDKIRDLQVLIERIEPQLITLPGVIEMYENTHKEHPETALPDNYESLKAQLITWTNQIADYKAQIAELQK